MIEELRIRSLGVIDEAVVPFAPGFTVLTGETGAGKTMVLSGLALITGGRADAAIVRSGAEKADVDGAWRLPSGSAATLVERLDDAGVEPESDGNDLVLLLGRSVASGGRSRAFAGGRAVPAATLAEVTEQLIAVHGQADQLLLRDPRRQRDLLDRFGGTEVAALRATFSGAYTDWRTTETELRELVEQRQEREREAALLRHGIDEISAVNPQSGEDEALKAQAGVLAHATDLMEAVGLAYAVLAGDEPPTSADLVAQATRSLDRARSLDPTLEGLMAQLAEAAEAVNAAADELQAYATSLDADPLRLAEVEERRQALGALKRRYGPELTDVLDWWASAEMTVAAVDGAEERLADLTARAASQRTSMLDAAQALSAARCAAAARFGTAVTAELQELAMPDAIVTVRVETVDDPAEFTGDGADTIAFLLRPHTGSDPRSLGHGASGGELSRVMLAIEVVLAGVNEVPTFVFDEVDAGIGGRVAVEVGRRLARLSRSAQVIVVTHLPQVAAFADQHVVVTKDGSGQVTESSVAVVEGQDRVRELVRMLSGLEDSASGAEHAAELLALAAADRSAPPTPTPTRRKARAR